MYNLTKIAKTVLLPQAFDALLNSKGEITVGELLTGNSKLDKGGDLVLGFAMLPHTKINDFLVYDYLVPSVCSTAILHGCPNICLGTNSGHYSMPNGSAFKALLKRSILWNFAPNVVWDGFEKEILKAIKKAIKLGSKVYIRLNVLSDERKQMNKFIEYFMEKYPQYKSLVEFYDYTKIPAIMGVIHDSTALSVSKKVFTDQRLRSKYTAMLPKFKYSAIVVPEDKKDSVISQLQSSSYTAIDGDLIDNFIKYVDSRHIILVLKSKASKNTKLAELDKNFALGILTSQLIYSKAFAQNIIPSTTVWE